MLKPHALYAGVRLYFWTKMMRLLFFPLVIAGLATSIVSAKEGEAAKAEVTAIEARFIYEKTGALSENIAPPSAFHTWNSMIGEGDAREPANDLLVTVTIKSEPAEANLSSPLAITMVNEKGRVIAKRKIESIFVKGGKAVRALFVPDAACLGKVAIKATLGASQRVANLQLNCGE